MPGTVEGISVGPGATGSSSHRRGGTDLGSHLGEHLLIKAVDKIWLQDPEDNRLYDYKTENRQNAKRL